MKRDAKITATRPDPLRGAVGLPVGEQGCFFVGEGGFAGQGDFGFGRDAVDTQEAAGITGYNSAPDSQPGLWCQWEPSEDRTLIQWDGSEKFYHYVEWINYLIENFLRPWGYSLSGEVFFQGEDHSDNGRLVIVAGVCQVNPASLVQLAECAGDLTEDSFEDS